LKKKRANNREVPETEKLGKSPRKKKAGKTGLEGKNRAGQKKKNNSLKMKTNHRPRNGKREKTQKEYLKARCSGGGTLELTSQTPTKPPPTPKTNQKKKTPPFQREKRSAPQHG